MDTNLTALPPVTSIDEKLREDGMQMPPWETPGVPVMPVNTPVNAVALPEIKSESLKSPETPVSAVRRKPGRPRKSEIALQEAVSVAPRKRGCPRKLADTKLTWVFEEEAPKRAERVKKGAKKVQQIKVKEKEKEDSGKRAVPRSGQSGPPIEVTYNSFNEHEKKVFGVFAAKGDRECRTISELAGICFSKLRDEQGNSWVRNSLRRLVRGGFLEKTGRGAYRQTEHGRREAKKLTPE